MNQMPNQDKFQAAGRSDGKGWTRTVRLSSGPASVFGYAIIAVAVAGFGYWAATAPLDGAIIAPGYVAAAGRNVQIQHLEGGIVKSILVRDGQRVLKDEPLVLLDETPSRITLNRLERQSRGLQARLIRLRAERDGQLELVVPEELAGLSDASFKEALEEQRNEFEARRKRYSTEQSIASQRISALEANMIGLEAQKKSISEQSAVVADEMARKKQLLDRGLTNRSEYTALLRSEADLTGRLGELESQIAATRIQVVEAHEQSERLTSQRVETAVGELTDARLKLDDAQEQINGAKAILERTSIRSPVDGVVVRIDVNAAGSVIAPGRSLLEILPTTSDLLVEARLDPRDKDVVKIGQTAKLRFSALNARITPEFPGTVQYVSADRLVDPKDQSSYFIARLKIEPAALGKLDASQIYPGMPVESFISTGSRTFAEYLLKPLSDSVNRAFLEE